MYSSRDIGYDPAKQTLEQYLISRSPCAPPVFHGYEPFEELWNGKWILPRLSCIQVDHSSFGCDQSYLVSADATLRGLNNGAFSGKEGSHSAKELLENAVWTLHEFRSPRASIDDYTEDFSNWQPL